MYRERRGRGLAQMDADFNCFPLSNVTFVVGEGNKKPNSPAATSAFLNCGGRLARSAVISRRFESAGPGAPCAARADASPRRVV